MTQALAVLNAGSSSLKFSVFAASDLTLLLHGQIEGLGASPHALARAGDGRVLTEHRWGAGEHLDHAAALTWLLQALPPWLQGHEVIAVGHRIVHGGVRFLAPVKLDADVCAGLRELVPLAPLHQPHNLAAVEALIRLMPALPQVGCFDTAFHAEQPAVARRFALPQALHDAGVMRYGFHGLSYEYIAACLPDVDARAAAGRTVVLHLGNGASMCALQGGLSVASTMGFTALDGLPMGTRCGNIDPGVLLWLMDERGMDARQIEHLLYSESGLLGVSGSSSDMRSLLASTDEQARVAVALYVYRIGRELGSLVAALGGLDALVFTAGIGENAAEIRARVCRDAAWLGVALDAGVNEGLSLEDGQSGRISAASSRVAVWVIPTNEELMIARHTRRLVMGG
ncbi:MAG: acetate/propionate family kinase [Aquabacterium sp.]